MSSCAPSKLTVSPDVMALESQFCRVIFSTQLRSTGTRPLCHSAARPFLAALATLLQAQGYPTPRIPCMGTIGETRGGFTTFKQPFVFSVADAERLETFYGGRLCNGPFQADFQRVGGPRSDRRLVVNVPDHFPTSEVHRLLSALPHVVSVQLREAFDPFGLQKTALAAIFSTLGPLPREVPLFAPDGNPLRTHDGRLCPPLRLDMQHACQPQLRLEPRPQPPHDPALPRAALSMRSVWGDKHKQSAEAAQPQQRPVAAQQQQHQQQQPPQRQQQPQQSQRQQQPQQEHAPQRPQQQGQQQQEALASTCEGASTVPGLAAPKRRPKATTGADMGGGAPQVKVARLPGLEPGFFNRPQRSRTQDVQRVPKTWKSWTAQLTELAEMDMDGASSESEYEEYGGDEDGHVSSCSV